MTPDKYIKQMGLSASELAKAWGFAPSSLTRAILGEQWPGPGIMVRFHRLSKGAVTLDDWIKVCRPYLTKTGIIESGEQNVRRRSRNSPEA